jgi:hypothetical protein
MISSGYLVEEKNRFGHSRSRLLTQDPWIALADWLMRAHKPLGFPPGSVPGQGGLCLEVVPLRMPANSPLFEIQATFIYEKTPVRVFSIYSQPVNITKQGFLEPTANIYQSSEYWEMLQKTKERIERFCQGDLQAAYIMAIFAARTPTHPFWVVPVTMCGRGLSM